MSLSVNNQGKAKHLKRHKVLIRNEKEKLIKIAGQMTAVNGEETTVKGV